MYPFILVRLLETLVFSGPEVIRSWLNCPEIYGFTPFPSLAAWKMPARTVPSAQNLSLASVLRAFHAKWSQSRKPSQNPFKFSGNLKQVRASHSDQDPTDKLHRLLSAALPLCQGLTSVLTETLEEPSEATGPGVPDASDGLLFWLP